MARRRAERFASFESDESESLIARDSALRIRAWPLGSSQRVSLILPADVIGRLARFVAIRFDGDSASLVLDLDDRPSAGDHGGRDGQRTIRS
jgi:hypothetical protein